MKLLLMIIYYIRKKVAYGGRVNKNLNLSSLSFEYLVVFYVKKFTKNPQFLE